MILAKGIVHVTFDGQTRPGAADLWNAIYDAGMTPVGIEMTGPATPPTLDKQ